jgi:hypothetical protein
MLPERKKLLVDALRSGEYVQGREQLRTRDSFCCLGVGCDIYGKINNIAWTDINFFLGERNYLPPSVSAWLGLDRNPFFIMEEADRMLTHHQYLAKLNDEGFTFSQIADLIDYFF